MLNSMHELDGFSAQTLWKKPISFANWLVLQWSGRPVLTRNGKRPKTTQCPMRTHRLAERTELDSRPWNKGGSGHPGEGGVGGGGAPSPKKFISALRASVWSKSKGARPPSPGSANGSAKIRSAINQTNFWSCVRRLHWSLGSCLPWETAHLPLPWAVKPTLTPTYFSLMAKCRLCGGVGGQFPETYNNLISIFPKRMKVRLLRYYITKKYCQTQQQ